MYSLKPDYFFKVAAFSSNDRLLHNYDALFFIQADGLSDPDVLLKFYKKKLVKFFVITGEIKRNVSLPDSRIAHLKDLLIEKGVSSKRIILEGNSICTREQAIEAIKLCKQNGWKNIILSAPIYHQPRLYATFVKAVAKSVYKVKIANYPMRAMSWFVKTHENKNRYHLLKKEVEKFNRYAEKGHIAGSEELLKYERWKESSYHQKT